MLERRRIGGPVGVALWTASQYALREEMTQSLIGILRCCIIESMNGTDSDFISDDEGRLRDLPSEDGAFSSVETQPLNAEPIDCRPSELYGRFFRALYDRGGGLTWEAAGRRYRHNGARRVSPSEALPMCVGRGSSISEFLELVSAAYVAFCDPDFSPVWYQLRVSLRDGVTFGERVEEYEYSGAQQRRLGPRPDASAFEVLGRIVKWFRPEFARRPERTTRLRPSLIALSIPKSRLTARDILAARNLVADFFLTKRRIKIWKGAPSWLRPTGA